MLKPSFALFLLIVSASLVLAQDSGSTGGSGSGSSSDTGSGSVILPSGGGASSPSATGSTSGQGAETGPAQTETPATTKTGTAPAEEKPSFSLPGGYGSAPLKITPGEGLYARPPISFTSTIQLGYTDNVYSSSGIKSPDLVISATTVYVRHDFLTVPVRIPERIILAPEVQPVHGSLISQISLGSQILFSASRSVFSLDLGGGGSYYWDRGGSPFSPSGNLALIYAYKLTPRSQFSASISGAYQNQPNLTIVNGPTQAGTGDYITDTERFDLSYRWTSRLSSNTTLSADSQYYMKKATQGSNYLAPTLGESLGYTLSPRATVILEVRATETSYQAPNQDSSTQYLLGGFDLTLSRRFTASIRGGETYREYTTASQASPYMESSLSYGYGKASTLSWNNRYGFEQGAGVSSTTSTKTFRSDIAVNQVFSAKLSTSLSVGYSNSAQAGVSTGAVSTSQDTLTVGLGAQYLLNRSFTLFGNLNRSQVFATPESSYSVDQVFLGFTYHF